MSLHDVLSDLIKTVNAGSFSAAFNALAEISKLCRKDTTAVSKFCDLKGIITLLGLIEKPKFSDITLSILANCCLVDKVREEVIKNNGVRSIVRILSCIEKESIRNRACRGLANIALTSRGARELYRCEATQHIAELLTSAKLKDTRLTALRALRILANIPNCRDDLVKHKAPAAIAKLLLTEPLQKSALQALTTVTQSCSVECALQVKEADGFKFLEELLSASDTTLLEGAFVLLVNLSVVEDVRPDLGAVGAVTSLVAQLNDYTLSKPSYGALFSALCRYSQESVNRIRVRETGGLSLLVDVLASKDKKDMWQCTTCAILQFRYDEPSLEKLWDLNLASTVLDHLESYIEEHKQEEHTSGDCAGQAKDTVQGDGSQDATSANIKDSVGETKSAPEGKEHKAGNAKKQESNRQDDVSDTKGTVDTDVSVNAIVKEDKLQDCNQTWHTEREEDFTDNSSTRKSEAIDFDEDDPELEANMGKMGSKVFCVHSPSYQEIQNENAAQHFEVNSTDSGYKSYQCSPNSPDYYCLPVSPRTAARSPRSPDSGVWSSCSSPRCESPVSVASPEPFRCFSPVCSDDEDQEENLPDHVKSIVLEAASLKPVRSKFIKRKKSFLSCLLSEDQEAAKAVSCISSDGRQSPPPLPAAKRRRQSSSKNLSFCLSDPQGILLETMLRILSVFSYLEKLNYEGIAPRLFCGLLRYMLLVPKPMHRAGQVLLRVVSNVHSFESIACAGSIVEFAKLMKSSKACRVDHCKRCVPFLDFAKSLLATLISVAESGFGSGVLAHCLLTCERKAQQHCCLTIPYIVRNKLILRQLLLECTGLELLLDMLEGNKDCRDLFSDAAASLQALCTSIAAPKAKRNTETSEKPDLVNTSSCFLGKFTTDVQFRMEDGSVVEGNRDQLSETNDYFRRMLSGHFQESNQSIVAFHCTRKTPLSVVVHFLHGCSFGGCPFLKAETTVKVDLDVLGLCDLLLLPELQRMTEARVKQCVKLEHVCDAYTKALELGMEDLRKAVLWYALTEKCDEERWNRCLHDLVFGPHGGQVLDDVASLVRRNSYSCVVADSAVEPCL